MKAVIQRVRHASVVVDGETVGSIESGLMALLGAARGDSEEDVRWIARKMAEMRIFSDAEGKFNLGLSDIGGAILLVSQFTLLADTRKGRRPSFLDAAPSDEAETLVNLCAKYLQEMGIQVETGRFGAHMEVSLLNDGPVTILLDSRDRA
jgi:D-tyrosyl-tRNA(Tyr) deacylase